MNRKIYQILCGLAVCIAVSACGNDNQKQAEAPPAAPAEQAQAVDAVAGAPTASGSIITGKVLETMDASGYTYINIDTGDKQSWVAVPQASVQVGEEVSVIFSMVMSNFESRALNRTFDEVIFASGFAPGTKDAVATVSQAAQAAGDSGASFADAIKETATMADNGTPDTGGSSKAVVAFAELKIDKAVGDNAYTVSEIFEKKAELAGKDIAIRGKVVKVSKNIMGKNWIHLQDGTGNPMTNTHDLVVTSATVPEADAIVTIKGKLEADKDFGAGYVYSVILEDVEITN